MAFFTGFFDESGKRQSHKVVSFAGFLEQNWNPFNAEWEYLLRKHKKPRGLHLSKEDLKASGSVIKIYAQFVQTIKKTVGHGFATAVDVDAFSRSHKIIRHENRDDPHYMAFCTVVRDVVKHVMNGPDAGVSLVCDDDPTKACACYKMFDVMRQNQQQPENRRTLKSITFGDSKYYYGLQAADLFAWVARAESLHKFFGQDYSLRQLFWEFNFDAPEFRTTFTTAFWDEARMKELADGCLTTINNKHAKVKR